LKKLHVKQWIFFFVESITKYPHNNIQHLLESFIAALPSFVSTVIKWGSFEERYAARTHFRGILPKEFQETTLIGDATDIPMWWTNTDVTSGENGIWSAKCKCAGI
jgi:hypothetical protein